MKTKLLTKIELATLASNLPNGTAKERATMAFEIWMESDPAKLQLAFYQNKLESHEAQMKKSVVLMRMQDALKELMPDTHAAVRLTRWEAFRRWQAENGVDAPSFEDDQRIGLFFGTSLFDELKQWEIATAKKVATQKAKTAAKARWGKTPEGNRQGGKAGGKTNQVKKIARKRK